MQRNKEELLKENLFTIELTSFYSQLCRLPRKIVKQLFQSVENLFWIRSINIDGMKLQKRGIAPMELHKNLASW